MAFGMRRDTTWKKRDLGRADSLESETDHARANNFRKVVVK